MRSAHAADPTYSINCGGSASGSFAADGYASGGTKYTTTAVYINTSNVQDAAPQAVYLSERYGMSFSYTFPGLTAGAYYPVRLHFAEYKYNAAGKRTFSVDINGQSALSGYDVFAAAGDKYKAVTQTFVTTADSSGKIKITFTGGSDNAEIKGIEIFGALKLTSPDPMGHPDQGDGKNQYTYDTTTPDGLIYIPGIASSTGAPPSVIQYLINSQNFDIGITPALPSQLNHTLAASGNVISIQTTGTDTSGNSIQANDFVANQLPANNSDFGNHNVLTTGGTGSQSATIQTFYTATVSNYPSSNGSTPNWYYYYMLLYSASLNPVIYDAMGHLGMHISYTEGVKPCTVHLSDSAYSTNMGTNGLRVFDIDPSPPYQVRLIGVLSFPGGIMQYIHEAAHERGHQYLYQLCGTTIDGPVYSDFTSQQNPTDPNLTDDGDIVADNWEANHKLSPARSDTAHAYTSSGTGDSNDGDGELLADVQALAPVFNQFNNWKQDWADGGVQYGAVSFLKPNPTTGISPGLTLTYTPVTGIDASGGFMYGASFQVNKMSDLPSDALTSLSQLGP